MGLPGNRRRLPGIFYLDTKVISVHVQGATMSLGKLVFFVENQEIESTWAVLVKLHG